MELLSVHPITARRAVPAVLLGPLGRPGVAPSRPRRPPPRDRERLVYILDPDAATCEALAAHFRADGLQVATATELAGFNAALARRRPDAALINASIGAADGLAVLRRALAARRGLPVFLLQDRPVVETAVAAIKAGAADVLTKPLDPAHLVQRVRAALWQPREARLRPPEHLAGDGGRITLTRREQQVLQLIADGRSNREAGAQLGISQRTIEVHRARVMEKFGARNTADLMRIVLAG